MVELAPDRDETLLLGCRAHTDADVIGEAEAGAVAEADAAFGQRGAEICRVRPLIKQERTAGARRLQAERGEVVGERAAERGDGGADARPLVR